MDAGGPGSLDLSDLDEWPDEELVGTLNEIPEGLRNSQLKWVGIVGGRFIEDGKLSTRLREVARNILKEWNGP